MPTIDAPQTAPLTASWQDEIETVRPTVLLLGGFLTAPPMYHRFAERLRARDAAAVVVSSVWTPDWVIAASRGLAAIATRAGRALLAASEVAASESHGAPLLVVGHSAGGVIARILTAGEPFEGRRFGAAARIGAIVTLGTPHGLSTAEGLGRRLHGAGLVVAESTVPGAWFAPDLGYVAVGSLAIAGEPAGTGQERVAYRMYRSLVGRGAAHGLRGDGLVPEPAARLEGARSVVVADAAHGPGAGGPWYGAEGPIDEWWPVALMEWRAALRCRAADPRASAARIAERSSMSRRAKAVDAPRDAAEDPPRPNDGPAPAVTPASSYARPGDWRLEEAE